MGAGTVCPLWEFAGRTGGAGGGGLLLDCSAALVALLESELKFFCLFRAAILSASVLN